EDGPLAHVLKKAGKASARDLLHRLTYIFGPQNVYVEVQRHLHPEQEHRNRIAVELAREFHLPLLATNGVLYATPEDREILDAFTCIKNKRDRKSTRLNSSHLVISYAVFCLKKKKQKNKRK